MGFHETSFDASEELARHAVHRFWLNYLRWPDLLAFALLVCGVAYLAINRESDWYVIVFYTLVAVAITGFGAVYFVMRTRALSGVRRLADRHVRYEFSEEGIRSESSLGHTFVKWQA